MMQWSGYWLHAVVGYNANGDHFRNHPASGYSEIANAVACQNTYCNVSTSSLQYKLSLPPSFSDQKKTRCLDIYNEDIQIVGEQQSVLDISSHLEPCPCTWWQAWRDRGRFAWQWSDYLCFIQRFPSNQSTSIQQCCYSDWRY